MNYFKGHGMGFVNRKQNQMVAENLHRSLKPGEAKGIGIIAGEQINDIKSLYSELYKYND